MCASALRLPLPLLLPLHLAQVVVAASRSQTLASSVSEPGSVLQLPTATMRSRTCAPTALR